MAEAVDLERLVPDAKAFLSELAENNDRAWFQTQKAHYDSALKRPAEKLLGVVAPNLQKQFGLPIKTKLFRPHRDVRFSENKAPFHTHLHMMWSLPDGRAWRLGISPIYTTLGSGIIAFDAAQKLRWIEAIGSDAGNELVRLLSGSAWRLDPPGSDAVPPPFPADHPRADLLRREELVVWQDDLEDDLSSEPKRNLMARLAEVSPVMTWLGRIARA